MKRKEYPAQDQISMHDEAINIPLFTHDGTFEKWVHEDELYVIHNGATHINYRTEDGKYQGYFEARKPRSVNYEQVLQHFNTACVEGVMEPRLPVFNEDGFLRWQQPLKGTDYPLSIQIDGREYQLYMSASSFAPVREISQLHLGYFSANCEGTEIETLRRFYDYDPAFNPERKNMTDPRILAFNALVDDSHGAAVAAGWYNDPRTGQPVKRNFGEMIALAHSELSEALEADRKNLMDDKLPQYHGSLVELIDLSIRSFDTIGMLIERLKAEGKLEPHVTAGDIYVAKRVFNDNREDHKPENRIKDGGKDY